MQFLLNYYTHNRVSGFAKWLFSTGFNSSLAFHISIHFKKVVAQRLYITESVYEVDNFLQICPESTPNISLQYFNCQCFVGKFHLIKA